MTAHIKAIRVRISTSDQPNSGTNDHIYVGVFGERGGAEFPLAVDGINDFNQGDTDIDYVLGDPEIASVTPVSDPRFPDFTGQGQENDPENYEIELLKFGGDLAVTQVYLRKAGDLSHDKDNPWRMVSARVDLWDGATFPRVAFYDGEPVWLGNAYGNQVWLDGPF